MGSHRAEPASSTGTPERTAAYVGRRIARPVVEVTSVSESAVAPSPVRSSGDPTPTTELPLLAPAPAGRRKATRRADTARPRLHKVPSAPVLLGAATVAIAVGGAVTAGGPALMTQQTQSVQAATALTGTSGVASGTGVRTPAINRSYTRTGVAFPSSAPSTKTTTTSDEAFTQHDQALRGLAAQAQHQATRLNNDRWILPVEGYHLTARFGDTGLWASFHTGLDFACATGTPIHAIASGIVTFASFDGAYGNKTVITLPDGTEIWYGHQTTQYVQVGDTVTRGDLIGTVGSTGHVTGPHVHIEVRPGGGDPVDPFPAFVAHGVTP